TSDTGATWAFKSTGLTAGNFNEIVVTNTNKLIVVKDGKGYWSSTDGGSTWTINALTDYAYHVMKLASDGTIIMYGTKVFRSTDNGANFATNGTYYNHQKIVEAIGGGGTLCGFGNNTISTS